MQKVDRKDGIESPSSVNKGQRWIRTINSLSSKTSTERKAVSGLLKLNREAVDETNPGSAGVATSNGHSVFYLLLLLKASEHTRGSTE